MLAAKPKKLHLRRKRRLMEQPLKKSMMTKQNASKGFKSFKENNKRQRAYFRNKRRLKANQMETKRKRIVSSSSQILVMEARLTSTCGPRLLRKSLLSSHSQLTPLLRCLMSKSKELSLNLQ